MTHDSDGLPDQHPTYGERPPTAAAAHRAQPNACSAQPWFKRRLQQHRVHIVLHTQEAGGRSLCTQRLEEQIFEELLSRSSLGAPHVQAACKRTSEATVAQIFERVRGLYEASGHISSAEPSRRWRTEQIAMAGKKSGETTSSKVASQASKILSNPKSSSAAKSVAASALTQAANKGKKGK